MTDSPWISVGIIGMDQVAPKMAGWYAVTNCWDAEEGLFPGADYWDGTKWKFDNPIIAFSCFSFASEEDADRWAYEHDMEK